MSVEMRGDGVRRQIRVRLQVRARAADFRHPQEPHGPLRLGQHAVVDHRDPRAPRFELRGRPAAVVVGALLRDALEEMRREVELFVRAIRRREWSRRRPASACRTRSAFTIAWTFTCWCFSTRRQQVEAHPQRQDEAQRRLRRRRAAAAPRRARRRCRSSRSGPGDRSACRSR